MKQLEQTEKKFKNIKKYVNFKINKNIKIDKSDIIYNNFPIIRLIRTIKIQIINFSNTVLNLDNVNDILDEIFVRIKKLQGKKIILSNNDLLGDKKKNYLTNETKNGEIKDVRPIESAAGNLSQKQKIKSLEIFFESILFLKSWEKRNNIKIVFLPSPSTYYDWADPIKYKSRY